jgi:hypothetical protein
MASSIPATVHVVQDAPHAIGSTGSFGTPAYFNRQVHLLRALSNGARSTSPTRASASRQSAATRSARWTATISVSSNVLTNAWLADRRR